MFFECLLSCWLWDGCLEFFGSFCKRAGFDLWKGRKSKAKPVLWHTESTPLGKHLSRYGLTTLPEGLLKGQEQRRRYLNYIFISCTNVASTPIVHESVWFCISCRWWHFPSVFVCLPAACLSCCFAVARSSAPNRQPIRSTIKPNRFGLSWPILVQPKTSSAVYSPDVPTTSYRFHARPELDKRQSRHLCTVVRERKKCHSFVFGMAFAKDME